jgi:hypothetical protein
MGNPWMQGEGWRLRVDFGDWPGGGAGVGTFANGRAAWRIREFRPGHGLMCLREGPPFVEPANAPRRGRSM